MVPVRFTHLSGQNLSRCLKNGAAEFSMIVGSRTCVCVVPSACSITIVPGPSATKAMYLSKRVCC